MTTPISGRGGADEQSTDEIELPGRPAARGAYERCRSERPSPRGGSGSGRSYGDDSEHSPYATETPADGRSAETSSYAPTKAYEPHLASADPGYAPTRAYERPLASADPGYADRERTEPAYADRRSTDREYAEHEYSEHEYADRWYADREHADPAPAPRAAAAPPAATFAGADPAIRDPGPGIAARFFAIVFAVGLTGLAVALFAGGIIVAAAAAAQSALSGEQAAEAWLAPLLLAGSVASAFVAMLTARWSGLGVGITGVTLLGAGLLGILFPQSMSDALREALERQAESVGGGPLGELLSGILHDTIMAIVASVSMTLSIVALLLGALFLAAGLAVHGSRRAGWRRGAGRLR